MHPHHANLVEQQEFDVKTMPVEDVEAATQQIDRLIALADTHEDFLLSALLCAARDHLVCEPLAHAGQ